MVVLSLLEATLIQASSLNSKLKILLLDLTQYKARPYPSEYRVEYFSPPYLNSARPAFAKFPTKIAYGQTYSMDITLPAGADASKVTAVLMDLSYSSEP